MLAKICDTNAVMLMKLHVDSITMAAIQGRMVVGGGSGEAHVTGVVDRRCWSFGGIRYSFGQTAWKKKKKKTRN